MGMGETHPKLWANNQQQQNLHHGRTDSNTAQQPQTTEPLTWASTTPLISSLLFTPLIVSLVKVHATMPMDILNKVVRVSSSFRFGAKKHLIHLAATKELLLPNTKLLSLQMHSGSFTPRPITIQMEMYMLCLQSRTLLKTWAKLVEVVPIKVWWSCKSKWVA
jgi:hypothetical protein